MSPDEPVTFTIHDVDENGNKERDTPSPGPDSSDLTGVGAVGEVVSGGDVRELTSNSSTGTYGSEETKPDEDPFSIDESEFGMSNLVCSGGFIESAEVLRQSWTDESPEVDLPWDGQKESDEDSLSGVSLAFDEPSADGTSDDESSTDNSGHDSEASALPLRFHQWFAIP